MSDILGNENENIERHITSAGLPPTPPDRDRNSGGMRQPPPPTLTRVGSTMRKSRTMKINVASNSVQFDTSTILEDFLYLGAKGVTGDHDKLSGLRIGFIVNCTQDPPTEYPENMNYFHVDVGDTANDDISKYFVPACEFIEEGRKSGQCVLVHCTFGMSRSTSIVLAYMIRHQGMSLSQALTHVKERRPVTSPNPGFMKQLVDFERSIRGKTSIDPEKYAVSRFAESSLYTL
jgi:hypothetical protein